MKNFFVTLFLILLLTPSQINADDIRDFQIEGISIGESLLDYFSKKQLNNAHEIFDYKNKKFRYYFVSYDKSQTYEYLQITVKPSDKNFIIQSIEGHILYETNINNCYKKMKTIKNEIDKVFTTNSVEESGNHPSISNSTYKRNFYEFENGSAELICYDMSEKSKIRDRLSVAIKNQEFLNFLTNEAY
tara:strand:- start:113 stop:676 length:564 start_codon:yes stop_codon:yes gene_type:complete